MTPRPSARASTYVGLQFKLSREASGSDHIHADRIAFLLARTARLTVSHVGSLRAPASPRLPLRRASPAGLIRHKADFTTFTAGAPGGNAKELAANQPLPTASFLMRSTAVFVAVSKLGTLTRSPKIVTIAACSRC